MEETVRIAERGVVKRWLMCPSLRELRRPVVTPLYGGVSCRARPGSLAFGRQFLALSRRKVGVGEASWRTGVAARCVTMTMHDHTRSATKQLERALLADRVIFGDDQHSKYTVWEGFMIPILY